MNSTIITPKTHPNHHVVGNFLRGWSIHDDMAATYYCDSYDPRIGYWITRTDTPQEHISDTEGKWRRNISERAISRTYHIIYIDNYGDKSHARCAWGKVDIETIKIPGEK